MVVGVETFLILKERAANKMRDAEMEDTSLREGQ